MFDFMFNKASKEFSSEQINKMIFEITTGALGEKVNDESSDLYFSTSVDKIYVCEMFPIKLIYRESGFHSKHPDTYKREYFIYYYGMQAYPKGRLEFEIVDKLKAVYKQHLQITKEKIQTGVKRKEVENKKPNVCEAFKVFYPNGYKDSKIIITNIEYVESIYYSSSEGDYVKDRTYTGEIVLSDGTILCNCKKDIYHPGAWEDYVISLTKQEKAIKAEEQNEKQKEAKLIRERKRQVGINNYNKNHSPIDVDKYF